MHRNHWAAVLVLLVLPTPESTARAKNSASLPNAGNDELSVIGLINTAESAYFKAQRRYAPLAELIQSGYIQRASVQSSDFVRALQFLHLQSDSQPVGDFTLNLTVPSDGENYHLYLTQRGEKCGIGWFTDETGILYGGKAVNCGDHQAGASLKTWNPVDVDAIVPAVQTDGACPLPQILHESSQRAVEMVDNLQRFTATEQIEDVEFGKNGRAHKSTNESFDYVAEIEQGSAGAFWIEESRAGKAGARPLLSDVGTAAFALIFHPHHLGNFDIRCEGLGEVLGKRAWQLRFEETSDQSKSFHQIRIDRSVYQLRFKGRAWIDAENYQVLRLQTDLVAPVPQIKLQLEHLDIAYAPVDFEKHKFRLWLPETASMHISYHGHRYERVHIFSHYQLFLVDTEQKVKQPVPGPSGGE